MSLKKLLLPLETLACAAYVPIPLVYWEDLYSICVAILSLALLESLWGLRVMCKRNFVFRGNDYL